MRFGTRTIRYAFAILAIASAIPSLAETVQWPIRTTPRPMTTDGVPHIQIGIKPVPELTAELLRRVDGLHGVEIRNTVISLPGAKGFWLVDDLSLARPDVIVGGREFAHVHPDGSLHASLSPDSARAAVEAGWAVFHPWSKRRPGWEGFVMIYTPSSADELDVVFQLVQDSYRFVTGREVN
ncbi:MAG: phospholipase [Gammaproteobacteria bacterium]|nr:MAG: phospholipase [Gammaproteobacteria bacterium]